MEKTPETQKILLCLFGLSVKTVNLCVISVQTKTVAGASPSLIISLFFSPFASPFLLLVCTLNLYFRLISLDLSHFFSLFLSFSLFFSLFLMFFRFFPFFYSEGQQGGMGTGRVHILVGVQCPFGGQEPPQGIPRACRRH